MFSPTITEANSRTMISEPSKEIENQKETKSHHDVQVSSDSDAEDYKPRGFRRLAVFTGDNDKEADKKSAIEDA